MEPEVLASKPFDTSELKNRLMSKLGEQKKILIDAAKAPVKLVVGETVDWAAEGCLKHENKFVKALSGLVAGMKQPLLDAIDKV